MTDRGRSVLALGVVLFGAWIAAGGGGCGREPLNAAPAGSGGQSGSGGQGGSHPLLRCLACKSGERCCLSLLTSGDPVCQGADVPCVAGLRVGCAGGMPIGPLSCGDDVCCLETAGLGLAAQCSPATTCGTRRTICMGDADCRRAGDESAVCCPVLYGIGLCRPESCEPDLGALVEHLPGR